MDGDRCGREAVMHAAYSGSHLCDDQFRESVEKRVRRRIRKNDLLPASPETPRGSSDSQAERTASFSPTS
jgi:hypothetical protein